VAAHVAEGFREESYDNSPDYPASSSGLAVRGADLISFALETLQKEKSHQLSASLKEDGRPACE